MNYYEFEEENKIQIIRVILKEPNKEPKVAYIQNDYEVIKEYCKGLIDITSLPINDNIDVILNDESLVLNMEPNIIVPEYIGVLAGPLIFTGINKLTGETISLNDEQVVSALNYIERNKVYNMSLEHAYLYSKVMSSFLINEEKNKTKVFNID